MTNCKLTSIILRLGRLTKFRVCTHQSAISVPRIATTSKFSEPRVHLHARLVSLTLRFVLYCLTIRLGHSCSPLPFTVVARVPLFSHLSFVSLTLSISFALSYARTCFTCLSSLSPLSSSVQFYVAPPLVRERSYALASSLQSPQ